MMSPGAEIERDAEWGSDIFACKVADCPWPMNEEVHRPWCAAIKGHACYGGPTHQHRPKKGMGGHNPESVIVSVICLGMHMAVDNGHRADGGYYRDEAAHGVYRVYRLGEGVAVLTRTIPESEVSDSGDD